MGKMNLLKANWEGKVGVTVGAKWKNKSTIRAYTKPAYTDTPAQQVIRTGFGQLTHYLASFTAQMQGLSALNLRGQTIRNALVKLNKDQVIGGALNPATLQVSRGGLPPPSALTASRASAGVYDVSCTAPSSPIISTRAKLVYILATADGTRGIVQSAPIGTPAASIALGDDGTQLIYAYVYLLDYRGSSKVGSLSLATSIAI
jgi:hypothetical protein